MSSFDLQDKVVGVVLCDLLQRDEPEKEREGVFPKKFLQLERFFLDLEGSCDIYEKVITRLAGYRVC